MFYIKSFFFAGKLAWKQITHEKQKLVAAVLGVMFATVLIFMQLGLSCSPKIGPLQERQNMLFCLIKMVKYNGKD